MPGAGGQDDDIAGADGNLVATFAAEDQARLAGREAEDLVGGRVVVVKFVDPVAPLRRPAVALEKSLARRGSVTGSTQNAPIEQHWEFLVVRYPAVLLKMQDFRLGDLAASRW